MLKTLKESVEKLPRSGFVHQKDILKQKPHFSILRNGVVYVQVMATPLLRLT